MGAAVGLIDWIERLEQIELSTLLPIDRSDVRGVTLAP